ncbi:MAG TPA: hypothetical protein VK249_10275 [Anaerolineales bacterium]|nr:hypothetical protein [Anaerolineales bacterium]
MFFAKYNLIRLGLIAAIIVLTNGCSVIPFADKTGPAIENITTSSKVLAKSDCIPTSLTITAHVTDGSGVASTILWYRVGEDQDFAAAGMTDAEHDQYTTTVKALDIPGGEYGVFEFYIVARDHAGNQTETARDKSVQLLPCVG